MATWRSSLHSSGDVMKFFNELKHYLSVYKEFVATSTSQAMSFRTSFVLMIVMDIFFFLSALLTVDFIYDHVAEIGSWRREELMFFITFMLNVDHLHMILLSHGFWRFSDDLKSGDLDYTLLRPLSSIFIVFFRYFKPSSIFNSILTTSALIYFGSKLGFGLWQWCVLPFLIILAFILLALLEFIISCAMFWLVEGLGINFLRMQMQSVSRWPDFIYSYYTRKVLTFVLPVLLIGSGPVHFILDPSQWYWIVVMFIAVITCYYVLHFIWNKGLNHYDSASS
jgi:ABC-2 type transport system permease protein